MTRADDAAGARRRLEHFHLRAALLEPECRGEPGDSRAQHQDVDVGGHRCTRPRYGIAFSITTATPRAPTLTGGENPSTSPLCGIACPEREMRAPTITSAALDNAVAGDIDIESSSVNAMGSSRTCFFMIASGMRGPSTGRA